MMLISYDFNFHHSHDLMVALLTYVIYSELNKLVVEMLRGQDAPIMIRYAIASLAVGATREVYIAMINQDIKLMFSYLIATFMLLIMRKYAINSTKDGR